MWKSKGQLKPLEGLWFTSGMTRNWWTFLEVFGRPQLLVGQKHRSYHSMGINPAPFWGRERKSLITGSGAMRRDSLVCSPHYLHGSKGHLKVCKTLAIPALTLLFHCTFHVRYCPIPFTGLRVGFHLPVSSYTAALISVVLDLTPDKNHFDFVSRCEHETALFFFFLLKWSLLSHPHIKHTS